MLFKSDSSDRGADAGGNPLNKAQLMMLCLIIKPSHLSGPDRMRHSNSFGRCGCFHLHTALEHVTFEVRTVGHISGADQKRGLSLLTASSGTTISREGLYWQLVSWRSHGTWFSSYHPIWQLALVRIQGYASHDFCRGLGWTLYTTQV